MVISVIEFVTIMVTKIAICVSWDRINNFNIIYYTLTMIYQLLKVIGIFGNCGEYVRIGDIINSK